MSTGLNCGEFCNNRDPLVAQLVKSLPAMRETQVWFLGWEDPLEKEMATHSSTLAWKNPMDGGAWLAAVHGVAKSRATEWLRFHFSLSCIGEGNGDPLQCSCLENPRDGRAWWAAAYGVAQSQTRLKRLSSSSSNLYRIKECFKVCIWICYRH